MLCSCRRSVSINQSTTSILTKLSAASAVGAGGRRRQQSITVDMPFQVSLVARQERPQPRGGLAVGAAAAGQLLGAPPAGPACSMCNKS